MPATCAAYGLPEACPAATFISFRFPSVKRDRQRREAWIRAVRRQNEDGSSPSNSPRHPDFVPSLFVYTDVFKKKDAFQRFSRMAARTRQRDKHRPGTFSGSERSMDHRGDLRLARHRVVFVLPSLPVVTALSAARRCQVTARGARSELAREAVKGTFFSGLGTVSKHSALFCLFSEFRFQQTQTSLPMTCTQETQTQEVVEKSGTELPEAPSNCRTRDCGMTTDLTFYCKECGGTFVTAMRLYSHQRASHQNASLKKDGRLIYKCSYCSYSNYNKACHAAHEQIHGVKHAYCKLCAKRFSSIEDFETHKRIIHAEERAFKCDECGQRFKYLSSLRRHEKSHSADAPLQPELHPAEWFQEARTHKACTLAPMRLTAL
ncbi:hypothetical protein HPB52_018709 [Rhipicephalus sanguineus]|uniref:C2H2-type domain-containing protein n=1 Tax=Rhipicephalus sanguineus TaxID=34632 RepID=A0A9D4PFD6_RHISA|nr:hypothetical protein HPB52_018709 [Rhipicephalus sanguineus]